MTESNAAAARLLGRYAKAHHAGGFATPSVQDLASLDVEWFGPDTVTVTKRLRSTAQRRDWRGCPFALPAGAAVTTHVAREGVVPSFRADFVRAYVEDFRLTKGLRAQGYRVVAHQISAAGELTAIFGHGDEVVPPLEQADAVDLVRVAVTDGVTIGRALTELDAVAEWTDDYPFYSDGSWSQVSLRGFDPLDPTVGLKPAEMSKAWKAEHEDWPRWRCDWTPLEVAMPTVSGLAKRLAGHCGTEIERVRLLRMTPGNLARHTDITDRSMGTRDGGIVRFHLPILAAPLASMHVWSLRGVEHREHLDAGEVWYLDARKPHAVENPVSERIHLTVDLVSNAAVRHLIEGSCTSWPS
jgi:hypothetical protein